MTRSPYEMFCIKISISLTSLNIQGIKMANILPLTIVRWYNEQQMKLTLRCTSLLDYRIMRKSKQLQWGTRALD